MSVLKQFYVTDRSDNLYLRFEHNSSSSYKHFTIQTHIVTKYGAHVYIKKEERKGKIDMNSRRLNVQLSFVSCCLSAKAK